MRLSLITSPAAPVHEGDELLEQLETLFAVRRPDFIRHLVRFGVDADDAEDITHDVFVGMLGAPEQRQPARLYAWLLTCAKNLAITRFHRRRRERTVVDELWRSWERTLADTRCDVERDVARAERFRQLAAALDSLGTQQRECLLLRSEGMTFRAIGEHLGLPMRRVVYLTQLAIEHLQRTLADARS